MEKSFDHVLEDVQRGQERLVQLVDELWRETIQVSGGHPAMRMLLGRPLIAEKLWTRMQLERGSGCQDSCAGPYGLVSRHVADIAAQARLYRDVPCDGFDLEGMKITVFVVRCFNASMALTQCRLCAASLVWAQVNAAMLQSERVWADNACLA
jgi:hypothetical protein